MPIWQYGNLAIYRSHTYPSICQICKIKCRTCNIVCKMICRRCKIIREHLLHVQNSEMYIFCIFCKNMHSPLWCIIDIWPWFHSSRYHWQDRFTSMISYLLVNFIIHEIIAKIIQWLGYPSHRSMIPTSISDHIWPWLGVILYNLKPWLW